VNFLEALPDTWIKASVSKYCDVRLGKMLQNDPSSGRDELKPYLRAINIGKAGLDLTHDFSMWITPAEKDRFRLAKGDILVSEGGDAGRTAVFDSDREYYFQNAINRVRPSATELIVPEFIYYWFTFLKAAGYVEMVCNVATIAHFTAEKVKAAPLALPPLDTQLRIARFLDEKTSQIDGLIDKKRMLLDRLAEKRQALITRAVTKGLNPNTPMKPSGIAWFGDIPAHWRVRRLNSFCDFESGKAHEPFIDPEGEHICVNARFVSTNGSAEKRCSQNLCPAQRGDILMVMSDLPNGRALARSFLVDDRASYAVNQRVCRIRPQDGLAAFFSYQLDRNPQLIQHDDGNEQTHLPNSAFKQMLLLDPPANEQRQIVLHLEEVMGIVDALSGSITVVLARLEEYRSALVTAAVTGQLDIGNGHVRSH